MSCLGHRASGSSRRAAGDAPSRKHRSFIRITRLVPRTPCLRATRFPSQSTFGRDRNSPPLAAMFCRDSCSKVVPRGTCPAHRFTLSPQRGSLPNPAASFGLDTLLVRALSSPHLSDVRMLPSDFCHPIHLYPSAPVLSTLTSALRIYTRTARGVAGSRRSTRCGGTARASCKLFTCGSRGDLRRLTPLSRSPRAHRGLSTTRVLAPGPPSPLHLPRRDAKPMIMSRDAFRRTLFERHSLRRSPASLTRR